MRTIALIEKGNDSTYSIFAPTLQSTIFGVGSTVDEAKTDFENSVKEIIEAYSDVKGELPQELINITFEYKYDVASLFNILDWINVTKFAKKSGINGSQMQRYKGGEHISKIQAKKIEKTLHELGREISKIKLAE